MFKQVIDIIQQNSSNITDVELASGEYQITPNDKLDRLSQALTNICAEHMSEIEKTLPPPTVNDYWYSGRTWIDLIRRYDDPQDPWRISYPRLEEYDGHSFDLVMRLVISGHQLYVYTPNQEEFTLCATFALETK
jgi:hypothetical protein